MNKTKVSLPTKVIKHIIKDQVISEHYASSSLPLYLKVRSLENKHFDGFRTKTAYEKTKGISKLHRMKVSCRTAKFLRHKKPGYLAQSFAKPNFAWNFSFTFAQIPVLPTKFRKTFRLLNCQEFRKSNKFEQPFPT